MMLVVVVVVTGRDPPLEVWESVISNVLLARVICPLATELSQSWVRLVLALGPRHSLRLEPSLTCRGWWQLVLRSTYSPSLGTGISPVAWNTAVDDCSVSPPYLGLAVIWGREQLIAASLVKLSLIRRGKNGRIWKTKNVFNIRYSAKYIIFPYLKYPRKKISLKYGYNVYVCVCVFVCVYVCVCVFLILWIKVFKTCQVRGCDS